MEVAKSMVSFPFFFFLFFETRASLEKSSQIYQKKNKKQMINDTAMDKTGEEVTTEQMQRMRMSHSRLDVLLLSDGLIIKLECKVMLAQVDASHARRRSANLLGPVSFLAGALECRWSTAFRLVCC